MMLRHRTAVQYDLLPTLRLPRALAILLDLFRIDRNAPSLLLFSVLSNGIAARANSLNAVYENPKSAQKAIVSVVALSTSIQDSTGNQQVYLASITLHGHATQLAKLVDDYPASERPIRMSLLREQRKFQMMLVKDDSGPLQRCAFYIGRNSAWVFDTLSLDTITSHPTDELPSYHVIHNKTILVKISR